MSWVTGTQTGMLQGIPRSAICVQRFDDSLSPAIHITYRISLRSSSLREPRHPLLAVVLDFFFVLLQFHTKEEQKIAHFVTLQWISL